ncbi:MAG: glycosyltransferase [Candidatus Eisenbacteria bacterium]|nr:glycosyltransferase [Candidatus Eisenbacteria bacterium]MCC7142085.1 glycosyltransferase [Candidatus Eisenbacteria bacterium]
MVSASHGPRGPGVRRSIAVIIPVRNAAATLEQSLGTLQRQTFPDFRVVLVDDGSTDETPQLLERLTRADRRFDLLRLSPGGDIARALEAGTAHLEEPLLARFDADDLAHPERFARQVDFLTRHPEIGLVATGVERFTTDAEGEALLRGELISPATTDGWRRYADWLDTTLTPAEIARDLWIESPLPHPSVMMRTSALREVGGYRACPWPEDYDLWLRMKRAGVKMAKLPERLHFWRDGVTRASRTQPRYATEAFLRCRVHHLLVALDGRTVVVWGAGRDGRRFARALLGGGGTIVAFLDIDPRKIGRRAYDRPILAAEEFLASQTVPPGVPPGEGELHPVEDLARDRPIVVAAVGTAGARELIRSRLRDSGWVEGKDFISVA